MASDNGSAVASASGVKPEAVEPRDEAVDRVQQLKRALSRARTALLEDGVRTEDARLRRRLSELADEVKAWDESLEEVRVAVADLVAERDRWKISHDKLRERVDHHSLLPRTECQKGPKSTQIPSSRSRPSSADGQDFSAIDRELERLNESMMRAFSTE